MSFNKSSLAFDDVRDVFDRALSATKGVRVVCKSRGAAIVLRSRFNYYRKMNRRDNTLTYQVDHPMYGRSVYDRLVLIIPPKGHPEECILFIEKRAADDLNVEDIQ